MDPQSYSEFSDEKEMDLEKERGEVPNPFEESDTEESVPPSPSPSPSPTPIPKSTNPFRTLSPNTTGGSEAGNGNGNGNASPREMSLMEVSSHGTRLIRDITAYLSTLPHPIEPIEELVSVCSVTCSLLQALSSTIPPNTSFPGQTQPFIKPLTQDILYAFGLLATLIRSARERKVFEPNQTGLVRVPRVAWTMICKGKESEVRSRCYVEKFRVRVLIDAAVWFFSSSPQVSERASQDVKDRLGLVGERLEGVWRDYIRRLPAMSVGVEERRRVFAEAKLSMTPILRQPVPRVKKVEVKPATEKKMEEWKEKVRISCESTDSFLSNCSSGSSITTPQNTKSEQPIRELWLLRHTPSKRTLISSTKILGLSVKKHFKHESSSYYVKPLPSCSTEVDALLQGNEQAETQAKNKILNMDDKAQWEIQRLIERREEACSSGEVKRGWNVIGMIERPRRKINISASSSNLESKGKWWKRGNGKAKKFEGPVEWVIVLSGQIEDQRERTLPTKNSNPWKQAEKKVAISQARAQAPPKLQQQKVDIKPGMVGGGAQPQGTVLRHVERRPVMGIEEAEKRMRVMCADLFTIV